MSQKQMQDNLVCPPGKNAADLGLGQAPLKPEDSIAAMLKVIRSMTPEKSGQFLSHEGKVIPY